MAVVVEVDVEVDVDMAVAPSQSCIFKQRTRARPYIQYLVFSIRQQQQHGAVRCRRFGFHYTSTSILVRVPRLMMVQLAHQGGSALPVL